MSDVQWDNKLSYGNNVDILKNAGMTWRAISEAATTAGHETPWPDGGRLVRARKQFLGGTEGQEPATRQRRKSSEPGSAPAKRVKWEAPWDEDTSEEDLVSMLSGKKITYVNSMTHLEFSCRIPKESKHTKIGYGVAGPCIQFASVEGPFQAIALSRIIHAS